MVEMAGSGWTGLVSGRLRGFGASEGHGPHTGQRAWDLWEG